MSDTDDEKRCTKNRRGGANLLLKVIADNASKCIKPFVDYLALTFLLVVINCLFISKLQLNPDHFVKYEAL
jgi:hypothetical protein